jgi:hypothetical protein
MQMNALRMQEESAAVRLRAGFVDAKSELDSANQVAARKETASVLSKLRWLELQSATWEEALWLALAFSSLLALAVCL